MLIEVGNVHAKLILGSEVETKWLDKILSFEDRSFHARAQGDGRLHLFSELTGTFPAGLVSSVIKKAKKAGKKIEVVDRRKVSVAADPGALIDWLRDHQADALKAAQRTPRGVFHHVTGGGKTEIIVGLGEVFPCRWLVFVHKKDLLHQTAARFAMRTGEQIGIIGDGKKDVTKRITVAMFQSINSALDAKDKGVTALVRAVGGVAVDECHVIPAGTFWRCLNACTSAYYRYGFSGTPFARTDRKSLFVVAALGPRIHRFSAEDGIKLGLLAKPRIQLTPVKHRPISVRGQREDWTTVYTRHVVRNEHRNQVVAELAAQATKPALLFVKAVEHGKRLEKILRARGEKVDFVWGEKNTPARRAAIQRLVHGDTDVLICNVIFQEGIDIPELRSILIASAGKSAIMVLQNTGRGTRRHAQDGTVTKDEFTVYDIQDIGCGCGGRHPACKWLEKHTRDRLSAFAMEKYPVFIKKLQLTKGANQ